MTFALVMERVETSLLRRPARSPARPLPEPVTAEHQHSQVYELHASAA